MTSQPVRKLRHRARRPAWAGLAALAILVGVAAPVAPTAAQADTIDWLDHSFGTVYRHST